MIVWIILISNYSQLPRIVCYNFIIVNYACVASLDKGPLSLNTTPKSLNKDTFRALGVKHNFKNCIGNTTKCYGASGQDADYYDLFVRKENVYRDTYGREAGFGSPNQAFLDKLAKGESSGKTDAEITIKDGRTFTGKY